MREMKENIREKEDKRNKKDIWGIINEIKFSFVVRLMILKQKSL